MTSTRICSAAACLAMAVAASQCTPYQQQGAAIGALAGGAIGAVAGNGSRDVVRGAAIGAAAGTGIAAIDEDTRRRQAGYGHGNAPPPPATRDHPVARRTANPNQVISPYPPYNVIDITGFRSGDLARDPINQQIFRVP